MHVRRTEPNEFERSILTHNLSLAPVNGTAFHEAEDLDAFLAMPPQQYVPDSYVVDRLSALDAVATISGPFGVGKNAAKTEAIVQSSMPHPRGHIPQIHLVLNGTTRLPEFRDERVEEDGVDYNFAFPYPKNRKLAQQLREGALVQYAQPRGDHVYFTTVDDFPTSGIALMDTVPSTVLDLNRILERGQARPAVAIYRTDTSMEHWLDKITGRGDILGPDGQPVDCDNYQKRMAEAASSLTEAMDRRDELNIKFFAAERRPDAGKAVIDILTGIHSPEAQARAIEGARVMLRGLAELGFLA